MPSEISIIHLLANATWVVQLVMLALLVFSVLSWAVIYDRWKVMNGAFSRANDFEDKFWSGADLGEIYRQVSSKGYEPRGLESIFHAGFKEFARLREHQGIDPMAVVEGAQRAMRVSLGREMDKLENYLSFLATVGSTSPYVGLFGTVWGIMHSFLSLGNVKHATIALVAPGIAEALIATAMGLFAAIPAVIAYNRYAHKAERMGNRYESFLEEFSTLLQRQAHTG